MMPFLPALTPPARRQSSPPVPLRVALLCAAGLLLAGCAETQFAAQSAKSIGSTSDWGKVGAYKVGSPYQVNGRWYYPKEDFEYQEEGVASWYGAEFQGKDTANGERFDQNALTAAHKTLPMPSLVRVTNLQNGRALVLRINDRGPFSNDRVIDVSRRASQLLGFSEQGTTRVRVEILAEESQALKQEAMGVQTGTPVDTAGAPSVVPAPRTKVSSVDIFEIGGKGESLLDTWPLHDLIAKRITPDLLKAIAAEHSRGRRLFILTANLDAGRPVAWNIGAIASRGDELNKSGFVRWNELGRFSSAYGHTSLYLPVCTTAIFSVARPWHQLRAKRPISSIASAGVATTSQP